MKYHAIHFILLFFLFLNSISWSQPVSPYSGYQVTSLDRTVDLLSGLEWTDQGVAVCDRDAGKLLLVEKPDSVIAIFEGLDTPVDVSFNNSQWYVLQEEDGSLISIDPDTGVRRIVASGLEHPSAFAFDADNQIYIVEFGSGQLIHIDSITGMKNSLGYLFDRPADILFLPPNQLVVADQIGSDGQDGVIYYLDLNGRIINWDFRIIDPTGLALSRLGDLYSSTFVMRGHSMGGRNQYQNGGVVRLRQRGMPETVVTDVIGPTSILFQPNGDLIVLEEPTDSIYQFTPSNQKIPLLEGTLPIQSAARLPNGEIIIIETGHHERLRFMNGNGFHQTWAEPIFGNWEQSILAADGLGNVYLSEPFLDQILVFDHSGKPVDQYNGIVPFHMSGIASGGIFAFSNQGSAIVMTKLQKGKVPIQAILNLDADLLSCYVREDGHLIMALSNGKLLLVSQDGTEWSTLFPSQLDIRFGSIIPDHTSVDSLWLLEENHMEILHLNSNREVKKVAKLSQNGVLLPDPDGVLFISFSGKRFLIKAEQTNITNWIYH